MVARKAYRPVETDAVTSAHCQKKKRVNVLCFALDMHAVRLWDLVRECSYIHIIGKTLSDHHAQPELGWMSYAFTTLYGRDESVGY